MRVLISRAAAASRAGDTHDTVEGELLVPMFVCASWRRCGCGEFFGGAASRRLTSVGVVAERAIDPGAMAEDLAERINSWLEPASDLAAAFHDIAAILEDVPLGTEVRLHVEEVEPPADPEDGWEDYAQSLVIYDEKLEED